MIALLVIFCMIAIVPVQAYGEDNGSEILVSGNCGTEGGNAAWTLDKSGTLKISGTGCTTGSPWEDYRYQIRKIIVEEGITDLGYGSFCNSTNLKEVQLPDSLVSIDSEAFTSCTSLEEIYLPDGMTSCGALFRQCTALKTVHLSESLKTLSNYMFESCTSLDNVVIPSGVKAISNSAFAFCSSLKNITIPEGVTKIEPLAFYQCTSLSSIDLPSTLLIIDDKAFYQTGLESLETPAATWRIGAEAFEYCDKLKTVLLNDGLYEIDSMAFAECYGNRDWVEIPESVEIFSSDAFNNNYDITLAEVTMPPKDAVYSEESLDGTVFSGPAFTPGPTVTYSGHVLTEGTDYEVKYELSADESTVFMKINGLNWFFNNTREFNLDNPNHEATTPVVIPEDSILASGKCGYLSTWILDKDGTLTISGTGTVDSGSPWYDYRTRITKVIVEEGIVDISFGNFQDCVNLKEVQFPEGLGSLSGMVFMNCTSLEEIWIPDNVTIIGSGAFSDCSSLKNVHLPKKLMDLGENVFTRCASLDNVVIPSGISIIQGGAFGGCSSLKNITIPDNVTKIGSLAFYQCTSLSSIDLPSSLEIIDDSAFYETGLVSLETPAGTWRIGAEAFSQCKNLKTVLLNDGLYEIGSKAFADCYGNRDWVKIPGSVEALSADAFNNNYDISLAEISMPPKDAVYSEDSLKDGVFTGSAFTPGPTVTYSGHVLTEGTDYEVKYTLSEDGSHVLMRINGLNWFCNSTKEFSLNNPNYEGGTTDSGSGNEDPGTGGNNDPGSGSGEGGNGTATNPGTVTGTGSSTGDNTGSGGTTTKPSTGTGTGSSTGDNTGSSGTTTKPGTGTGTGSTGNDKSPATDKDSNTGDNTSSSSDTETKTDTEKKTERISISKAKVSDLKDSIYTGSRLKPRPSVTYKGKKLIRGKDYKLTYANNKNVGTATVTISGINKYKGSVKAKFKITQAANKITLKKKTVSVSYGKKVDLTKYASSIAALRYKSDDKSIATVTKDGVVKFKHPGTVKIKLTSGGTNYKKKTKTITITSSLASPKLKVKRSKGRAKLTWTKVNKATAYKIYIRYPGKKSYALALTKSSKVKSVTHRGLSRKKIYRYKVRAAIKIKGKWYYSPYSNIVKIKAK